MSVNARGNSELIIGMVVSLAHMADEPTQETEYGAMIPVPDREDVMAALRKTARATDPDESD